ncbi:MarR family winged helix-turn-helix transcriptional regulator [Dehalobacter sp. DCM]|uniref:MarR family winged helix-turn-helix transcriptional regulator n=1 Tax=Dehalobacter sp. DCM TaxID=2907827 RepID=UPI00308165AA|nr:MarR family winged helix-turn-helix transcriptional regulator [Dehalobacter sp. DCM]
MNNIYGTLNELLVKLFNNILHIEELALKAGEFNDLTINEIHVIEAIGLDRRNMSSVAKDLDITIGTLTISINNLYNKGYVNRTRGNEDRRIVFISLTDKGQRVYSHHAAFHEEMIKTTISKLNEEEMAVLVSALGNINIYFKEKYNTNKKG